MLVLPLQVGPAWSRALRSGAAQGCGWSRMSTAEPECRAFTGPLLGSMDDQHQTPFVTLGP